MDRRTAAYALLAAVALAVLAVWLAGRLGEAPLPPWVPSPAPPADRLTLEPVPFDRLPGWRDDRLSEALPALLASCRRLARRPDEDAVGTGPAASTVADWRPVCAAAAAVPPGDDAAARAFFEAEMRPLAARAGRRRAGLFTGYYEPLLEGSRKRSARFGVPLYRRPPELVMVDLGLFREALRGQRIAGEVEDGALVPYPDRREIDAGALAGRGLELAWVDDPVDAFFLHIQGSGRVRLAEGGTLRVGYAAQNGHPYLAIGRDLVARGALAREEVSMQSIRRWLAEHPEEGREVMAKNASYVFFQEIEGEGPLGAQGVALTPGRSLAVDPRHVPLGVPVWLDGRAPAPEEGKPDRRLRRLLVAQDTGGAISGPIRGDVFWGHGEEAEAVAGRMKHPGRVWLLLPKAVVQEGLKTDE